MTKTSDDLSPEQAFSMQKSINDTIDFDQTMNAISILRIQASTLYVEKLFCDLNHDGIGRINLECFLHLVQQLQRTSAAVNEEDLSDEKSVVLSNSDKAKAWEQVVLLAQTKGSVTLADINAIWKEITSKN